MAIYRYIYWRRDRIKNGSQLFANVHLLSNNPDGLNIDFDNLILELKKTFPEAPDDKINRYVVKGSSRFTGFYLITWDSYIKDGQYPGWVQDRDISKTEYSW